ncbi:oxoglutarate-Fe(II) type oxidoreductase [Seminavis robusta]|uniref:Oxoglutarate-Fe(II) type oxidoreductase n=1 Tax=Seminavis robusta TaxID=568900 RepID=A0A9N8EZF7_9STRA|nr:oxoglutarate-Fe(II) type oxidoreductase [Seminavis robusta]|eukprot:Sro2218_g319520.1 oxoglutarate-Fe(II) type oxidoreductase (337) ;mRNA; r:3518-4702
MDNHSNNNSHSVPVIRLDDEDNLDATAKLLRATCIETGFFYLEGHGVSQDLLDKVMDQSKRLFGLSNESKDALKDPVMSRGYTSMEQETLDPKNQKKGDTKEGFYIATEIPKDDPRFNPTKLAGPNCWPTPENTQGEFTQEDCQEFRTVMDDYLDQVSRLGFRVTQLLALALELDQSYFDPHFQEPMPFIRLLHYANETSKPEEGIFACGAHSDYGMITLLLTDHNPGLQIYHNNQWIDVPPRPSAFVVNLGDMLERWSNGLFKSTLHRVITSGSQAGERYSIPFFYEPNFDTLVTCLPTCCSEDNPARYPPITSGQHLLDKYKGTHAEFRPGDTL